MMGRDGRGEGGGRVEGGGWWGEGDGIEGLWYVGSC